MSGQGRELARLGYCELWLESGVLTPDDLSAQIATITQEGADQNTEHYRYGTFRHYLGARATLNDDALAALLALISLDEDRGMAGAMLHDLAKLPALTTEQFERLAAHSQEAAFRKCVARERLKRAFRRAPADALLQQELAASGDTQLEGWLVDQPQLDPSTLKLLASVGKSKRTRNIARTRLNRTEYQLTKS